MNYEFHATHIGIEGDDDAIAIGFGGLPDQNHYPTIGLIISRYVGEDNQGLDIDGVYIEWNDQHNSCYGCLERVHLHRERLEIRVSADAALLVDLQNPSDQEDNRLTELRITFSVDDTIFANMRHILSTNIFFDCSYFSIAGLHEF